MKDLLKAIREESDYVSDRMKGINTNLAERLVLYGYESLEEYFIEKKAYLFEKWIPEVFYVDEEWLNTKMESAIASEEYGVYIIAPKSKVYAFHGNDDIDIEECRSLGVKVIEMRYAGGTIIGSSEDFGIMVVAPVDILLTEDMILSNVLRIIRQYAPEAEINGNDILVDGEKIMGSMRRNVGNTYVWAAQFSFAEHDELIYKLCKKETKKRPGAIGKYSLQRDYLEAEVLKWLRKKER